MISRFEDKRRFGQLDGGDGIVIFSVLAVERIIRARFIEIKQTNKKNRFDSFMERLLHSSGQSLLCQDLRRGAQV